MASASPNVAPYFAVGTTVGAYPRSSWVSHERPPVGVPKGAATATATVSSAGVAAFTGLTADTHYYVTDSTGSRYVNISTYDNVPPAQQVSVGSSSLPNIVAAGNLGASRSLALSATIEQWLVGTLTANHTLTLTGIAAGAHARLFLVQDATGSRTLTISNGTTTQAATVATAAGAATEVDIFSPDGSTLYVNAMPSTGPTGSRGSQWFTYVGAGTPTGITGMQAGDFALRSDGEVFTYSGSAWTDTALTIKGAPGVAGYQGVFGDGSDGAVVLDGTTGFTNFSSLAGSTYTLTRDIFATNLTINAGVTVATVGFRIYCLGTLTNNGTISAPGNNASGFTQGGATGQNSIGGGAAGAVGPTGVGTTGTQGHAGNSGAGGSGTSGAGGASVTSLLFQARLVQAAFGSPMAAATGVFGWAGTARQILGGSGGSSGAGDGTNKGGAGGSGGGVIVIFAIAAVNNGTITVAGGNGGTPSTGNCGGGGPGGGGFVLIYSMATATGSGSVVVSAGTAGSGVGTGAAGSAAPNTGTYLNKVLS